MTPSTMFAFPFFTIAIFLFACNNTSTGPDDRKERRVVSQSLSYLNISDAKLLVLENAGPAGIPKKAASLAMPDTTVAGDTRTTKLYKITENNVYEEVTNFRVDTLFIDSGNSSITKLDTVELTTVFSPRAIVNAGSDFMYASFTRTNGSGEYNYLVRKSDGAVFETSLRAIGMDIRKLELANNGYGLFQVDGSGNLFCNNGGGVIERINIQNPRNLLQGQLTSNLEQVSDFVVNSSGHIMYSFLPMPIETGRRAAWRLRYASGGLRYVDKALSGHYWMGFDGCFYYTYSPTNSLAWMPQSIRKITIQNNIAVESDLDTLNFFLFDNRVVADTNVMLPGMEAADIRGQRFDFRELDKIIIVNDRIITEVYNSQKEVKAFATAELGITGIRLSYCSGRYYYLAGLKNNQPIMVKVDPSVFPHSSIALTNSGEYDTYQFVVSLDGEVSFNALRMSDGKVVIGNISSLGVLTIQQEVEKEVRQLVRVQ